MTAKTVAEVSAEKTAFETTVCERCGGTGRYSWNSKDGSKCYGCGGKGVVYTKRGAKAHEYFLALL